MQRGSSSALPVEGMHCLTANVKLPGLPIQPESGGNVHGRPARPALLVFTSN